MRIKVLKVKTCPIKFRETLFLSSIERQFSPEAPISKCVKMEILKCNPILLVKQNKFPQSNRNLHTTAGQTLDWKTSAFSFFL